MFKDLVAKNRSYRKFYEELKISTDTLVSLVDLARLSASARNMQPLRFLLSNDSSENSKIFQAIAWAGYLDKWSGPKEGERPSAYIVILEDLKCSGGDILTTYDTGIAAQTILLGATEIGLGGCMIGAINHKNIKKSFNLSDEYRIKLIIAIGKPKESVIVEKLEYSEDLRYWRDEQGVHHVPKRDLEDIIIGV